VDLDLDRIRVGSGFRDFVDPDPYSDPGARKLEISVEKMHFLVI
jgi:hypothetical protein